MLSLPYTGQLRVKVHAGESAQIAHSETELEDIIQACRNKGWHFRFIQCPSRLIQEDNDYSWDHLQSFGDSIVHLYFTDVPQN